MDEPSIPPLKTIANAKPDMQMTLEHILHLPELCPASKNPKPGSTMTLSYQAGAQILELFSLDQYIAAFRGHPIVRDMEYFTQVVAQDAADTLGHQVSVHAELSYNMINQQQRISVLAKPSIDQRRSTD